MRPDYKAIKARYRDTRPDTRIRLQYDLEKRLAASLKNAEAANRSEMYTDVYKELFACCPDIPHEQAARERRVRYLVRRLRSRAKAKTFLEVGCGDAALSSGLANLVHHAYAMDVTDAMIDRAKLADNLTVLLTSGVEIGLPSNSIDLCFSDQLLEHLHIVDAEKQLREIYRVLKPGGSYHCITPSRLTGPHDISVLFDYEASGLHLCEYDSKVVSELFRSVGFQRLKFFVSAFGYELAIPSSLVLRCFEKMLESVPLNIRGRLSRNPFVLVAAGLDFIAIK